MYIPCIRFPSDYGIEIEQAFFVNSVAEGGVAEKVLGEKLQAGDIIMKVRSEGSHVVAVIALLKEGKGSTLSQSLFLSTF